jgi:hypothetical protein
MDIAATCSATAAPKTSVRSHLEAFAGQFSGGVKNQISNWPAQLLEQLIYQKCLLINTHFPA